MLLGLSTPVALAVVVFFIYSLIAFRERDTAAVLDGPPVRGHAGVQLWWIVTTTTIVLFLAGYGTVRMLADGAGGGQGPNPIAKPTSSVAALPVQVIGQQWKFTFRFPTYGGVETNHLELPANRLIAFHVTSLDVIHSFWAYQLGVKADANPGVDNVAYVQTKNPTDVQHPLRRAVRRLARLHVRHRRSRERAAVRLLDRPAAAPLRAGHQDPAAVLPSSTSRTPRGPRWMSSSRTSAPRQASDMASA